MQTLHCNDCLPCEKINKLLESDAIDLFLEHLGSSWHLTQNKKSLIKKFNFKTPYQTMAFINAIGWMTHFKDHPPKLEINGTYCFVRYTSSKINGLSEYDFLCANKVENLFTQLELMNGKTKENTK